MRQILQAKRWQVQRGAIAVEAAIVLPILVTILLFPSIFWALYFYKYSAAQKAVHDAALYLSTAPRLEMTAAGPDGSPVALTLAKRIIAKELLGQNLSDPGIVCTYLQQSGALVGKPCSTTNNQDYKQTLVQLDVSIDMSYIDPFTGTDSGMKISPYADVPYLGN
jgi:Flp pilus assembly protein TadG